jgi:Uma2 family endonuclease
MVTRTIALGPEFDLFRDDDEETLVGSSSHQGAIVALYEGLSNCGRKRGLPWFVGNQLTVLIPREGRKPPLQPSPDILVHPTLAAEHRSSLDVVKDGPPALVIEVVSPATALDRDLNVDLPIGKPGVYAAAGIGEYLVFDPLAEFLPERVRAWRLSPHGSTPWLADEQGHWVSDALGVSFSPQGPLLRVYDQDGSLMPLYAEAIDTIVAREREIAALQAELRRLRGE